MNKFEYAAKNKLRFDSPKGMITVEDLWDLPLTSNDGMNLDALAKDLYKKVNETEISFVKDTTNASTVTNIMFDIVKHIIDVKMAELDKAKVAAENKAKRDKIVEILKAKQDSALENESVETLQAMLEELK